MLASFLQWASSGMLVRHLHRHGCSVSHSRWQGPGRARGLLLAAAPVPGGSGHRDARSRRYVPARGLGYQPLDLSVQELGRRL